MQKITVFQQNGSGKSKIAGIKRFGKELFNLEIINIDEQLPCVIDDSGCYLPGHIDADLVLDYLKHPDLSYDLAILCRKLEIPIVASGKKNTGAGAMNPSTCCMLPKHEILGRYGKLFGAPEINIKINGGYVEKIDVVRGSPCGATWDAAKKIKGLSVEDAAIRFGLEVQFFCTANPASWDPITGKSPVHIAADIHTAAFNRCLKKHEQYNQDSKVAASADEVHEN